MGRCLRDHMVACHHQAPATQVVFVPVDGRVVFFTCLLLIVLCVAWLAMWLFKGVKFEEE
jgi:hypothetical protein